MLKPQAKTLKIVAIDPAAQTIEGLEVWIDHATEECRKRGCHGPVFEQMRKRHGTREAMERLVRNGEIQSGFKNCVNNGAREWTIEAGILTFPLLFTEEARRCADFRIQNANDPILWAR